MAAGSPITFARKRFRIPRFNGKLHAAGPVRLPLPSTDIHAQSRSHSFFSDHPSEEVPSQGQLRPAAGITAEQDREVSRPRRVAKRSRPRRLQAASPRSAAGQAGSGWCRSFDALGAERFTHRVLGQLDRSFSRLGGRLGRIRFTISSARLGGRVDRLSFDHVGFSRRFRRSRLALGSPLGLARCGTRARGVRLAPASSRTLAARPLEAAALPGFSSPTICPTVAPPVIAVAVTAVTTASFLANASSEPGPAASCPKTRSLTHAVAAWACPDSRAKKSGSPCTRTRRPPASLPRGRAAPARSHASPTGS